MVPRSGLTGSTRIRRLSGVALAAAEKHGKRLDEKGQARRVIDVEPVSSTGLDLGKLYENHIEGAALHKSGTKALHMLVQFPTELVDGEDPQTMLQLARSFATSVFGDAAIFADRIDRDEKSRHVVDLFLAPKYDKITKKGSTRTVSTSRHLKALAAKHGRAPSLRGQGQALQDAFAAFLHAEGYTKAQRGQPKKRYGNDRLEPEQLEENRLEALRADVLDALKPPTRRDLLRPAHWFDEHRRRLATALEPLLAEASETATERLRAREVGKQAAEAEKRASDAHSAAEAKFDRFYHDRFVRLAAVERSAKIVAEDTAEKAGERARAAESALQPALDELAEVKGRLKTISTELGLLKSFLDSTRSTLKRVMGDGFEALRQRINQDWARHPDNPHRPVPQEPSSGPSGPSLG